MASIRYDATWRSLREHSTPQWFRDAKFGIYTHWGVYSVPGFGSSGAASNATWYPHRMYVDGSPHQKHHLDTYGPLDRFGYKDFVPMFTAPKFDPDEWAELFKAAGARFAGPVGEHHDGFSLWATDQTEWHAGRLGPKRDIVAELERSIRGAGMRYMVALHHAEHWWFYPHWRADYDTGGPDASSLYGEPHNLEFADGVPKVDFERSAGDLMAHWWVQDQPGVAFCDQWIGKTREVIDRFNPDLLWFDFGINWIRERYLLDLLAYYYNRAGDWGREVAVTYKHHHLVPGSAVVDLELGRFAGLTYHDWLTDTSIDAQGMWAYVEGVPFKTTAQIIHNLVDNVAKNGYLLLNVGPRADGSIPEDAQAVLRGIGRWLQVNGEAIFDTTPWKVFGEGPNAAQGGERISEKRSSITYTAQDVRYTCKGNELYAICLGGPTEEVVLRDAAEYLHPGEVAGVAALGSDDPLAFEQTRRELRIRAPRQAPAAEAVAFRITRR